MLTFISERRVGGGGEVRGTRWGREERFASTAEQPAAVVRVNAASVLPGSFRVCVWMWLQGHSHINWTSNRSQTTKEVGIYLLMLLLSDELLPIMFKMFI